MCAKDERYILMAPVPTCEVYAHSYLNVKPTGDVTIQLRGTLSVCAGSWLQNQGKDESQTSSSTN